MSPARPDSGKDNSPQGGATSTAQAGGGALADPVEGLGYEAARDELIDVVRRLEQGGLTLDDSVALWERGEALVKRCEEHLDGAAKRVDAVLAEAQTEDDEPGG